MDKYIKTVPIEAEQFDGSDEMVKKYHVRCDTEYMLSDDPLEYQTAPYQIETLDGWLNINAGDWIATGAMGEHYPIADEIFKQTYHKLPVIPAEVANAVEEYRDKFGSGEGLFTLIADISAPWALGTLETVTAIPEITLREFIDKTDVLARAWLDGYEIETKS